MHHSIQPAQLRANLLETPLNPVVLTFVIQLNLFIVNVCAGAS